MVAELSGQYGSNLNLRDIAVGPQFLYPRGKVGIFRACADRRCPLAGAGGNTEGDTARAVVLGGGMDHDISPRFAMRVFQVDYMHTTLFKDHAKQFAVFDGPGLSLGHDQEGTPGASPESVNTAT